MLHSRHSSTTAVSDSARDRHISRLSALITCPKNVFYLFPTVANNCLLHPSVSRIFALFLLSVLLTLIILVHHHIFIAFRFCSICLLIVQASHSKSSVDQSYVHTALFLVFIHKRLLVCPFFIFLNNDLIVLIFLITSVAHLTFEVSTPPRYWNSLTLFMGSWCISI